MEKDYTFYPTETESPKFLSSAQFHTVLVELLPHKAPGNLGDDVC